MDELNPTVREQEIYEEIQHLKVGRSYRIPKAHLLTYLIGFAPGHTIRA